MYRRCERTFPYLPPSSLVNVVFLETRDNLFANWKFREISRLAVGLNPEEIEDKSLPRRGNVLPEWYVSTTCHATPVFVLLYLVVSFLPPFSKLNCTFELSHRVFIQSRSLRAAAAVATCQKPPTGLCITDKIWRTRERSPYIHAALRGNLFWRRAQGIRKYYFQELARRRMIVGLIER